MVSVSGGEEAIIIDEELSVAGEEFFAGFFALDGEESFAIQGDIGGIGGANQCALLEIDAAVGEIDAATLVAEDGDGIFHHAEIFVNGVIAGLHDGEVSFEAVGLSVGEIVGEDGLAGFLGGHSRGGDIETVKHVRFSGANARLGSGGTGIPGKIGSKVHEFEKIVSLAAGEGFEVIEGGDLSELEDSLGDQFHVERWGFEGAHDDSASYCVAESKATGIPGA